MTGMFELRRHDLAGRLGRLSLPGYDSPIETPALLPVIDPNIESPSAADIVEEFDPEGLITNAYLIYKDDSLRRRAAAEGVHGLLDVDVPVMTDSGSFQLATYGDIDVDNEEILSFQATIDADICTPIDLPTPPSGHRDRAVADLETTLERIEGARSVLADHQLLSAPVQGGRYPDLRTAAARRLRRLEADVYPIGAVVPLLKEYRYADVVDVVVAVKRGLGPDVPVHLFGAGHPMMFSLAVAMGCDLFDSAAYALYARDDRYLTVSGTKRLETLEAFPCPCPVCTERDPTELKATSDVDRTRLLARHNLYVTFAELRRIIQAIRTGTLVELLERRARAHPAMLDGFRRLLDHDHFLERHDPATKGTVMYVSSESARRPEVGRHHRRLRDWSPSGTVALVDTGLEAPDHVDHRWSVTPPFGPVPPGLEHTYPLTVEVPDRLDEAAFRAAARGVYALTVDAIDADFVLVHRGWPEPALAELPGGIRVIDADHEPV